MFHFCSLPIRDHRSEGSLTSQPKSLCIRTLHSFLANSVRYKFHLRELGQHMKISASSFFALLFFYAPDYCRVHLFTLVS